MHVSFCNFFQSQICLVWETLHLLNGCNCIYPVHSPEPVRNKENNGHFQTVVLEKTLESPLDSKDHRCSKEIEPVNLKGSQAWIFTGNADAEAETPILWPPDAKSWLTGKDPDAGQAWRQEEKGTKADEMVGWPHQLNRHESEQTQGDSEGQGSLAFCSPWGCK